MIFLISLVVAVIFILLCSQSLKKHPTPYYIAATVIALTVFICTKLGVRFPEFIRNWIWPLVSRGALAGAFFIVVMITGALPNGSKAIKLLMPIRGELSIIASILTLGHNAAYGLTYFRLLFTNPSRLPTTQLLAAICSVLMILIMLPLFITSFKNIRKRMNAKKWKKLQRFAYLFYGLLFTHIMLLVIPQVLAGRDGYTLTFLVYSSIFIGYTICRIIKYSSTKSKHSSYIKRRQLAGTCIAVAVSVCFTCVLTACAASDDTATISGGVQDSADIQEQNDDNNSPDTVLNITDSENTYQEDVQSESEDDADDDSDTSKDTEKSDDNNSQQEEPPVQSSDNEEEVISSNPQVVEPNPKPEPEPDPEPVRKYMDGTFTGTGEGFEGPITVSVTIKDDVITAISVTSSSDDEPYFSDGKTVINSILSAQSANVDTVSGATYSSGGIIDAVAAALNSAKN